MNLEVIHRLEAGGTMPGYPGKSHANHRHLQSLCQMDFYWRDLLYIERVFLEPFPFFKYFLPRSI